ncbi:hypothetical protein QWZ04_19860 [Vibrio tapetis subsp. quintayensis]|uniref:ABC transporter substrate-binding protein n=1 Tax=Vibrio tapetis TaxID=52443 RepID=UPI0025B4A8B4|nr:hypothetical protein [Vibrio tapetis]MDN3682567.1 hypothetical protein [Vibrio tapetis subsp. quintayensis]
MALMGKKYFKLLLTLGIALTSASAQTQSESVKLSFIHSYHFDYLWVQDYRRAFLKYVDDSVVVEEFEMDTKRKFSQQDLRAATKKAKQFFRETQPNLVVLADDAALQHVGAYIQSYDIPIFFSGINNNPRNYIDLNSSVSGVLERPLLLRSASLLGHIVPGLSKIKVLMDASTSSRAILETSFANKMNQTITGIELGGVMLNRFDEWQQEVLSAKSEGYDAIMLLVYSRLEGDEGTYLTTKQVDSWTSQHSELPVFAGWEFSIGKGRAIGGFSLSGYEQGKALAEQVNYYLKNNEMPTVVTPKKGAYVFSEYELERWNIRLPNSIDRQTLYKK